MIPTITYDRPVRRSQTPRKARAGAFLALAVIATSLGVVVLAVLLVTVSRDGIGVLSLDFLNRFPHYKAELAGVKSALAGTLWVMAVTAIFAITFGVGAAVYLEEFASRNWFTKVVETNINNLAGVPSVVYGLLGLSVFVYALDLGFTIMSGGLTLALLILPIIVVASQGGAALSAPFNQGGGDGPGRNKMAGRQIPGPSRGAAHNPDRLHSCTGQGNRRDCASDCSWSL